jgi:hypothetical protein
MERARADGGRFASSADLTAAVRQGRSDLRRTRLEEIVRARGGGTDGVIGRLKTSSLRRLARAVDARESSLSTNKRPCDAEVGWGAPPNPIGGARGFDSAGGAAECFCLKPTAKGDVDWMLWPTLSFFLRYRSKSNSYESSPIKASRLIGTSDRLSKRWSHLIRRWKYN